MCGSSRFAPAGLYRLSGTFISIPIQSNTVIPMDAIRPTCRVTGGFSFSLPALAAVLAALTWLASGCKTSTDPLSASDQSSRTLAKSPNGAPPSGHTDPDGDWLFPWEPSIVDSVTPSTNYENMLAGQFYFEVLDVTPDSITILFHSGPHWSNKAQRREYEVRIDGEGIDSSGTHPNIYINDSAYFEPYIYMKGPLPPGGFMVTTTYGAESHIDIRFAHDSHVPYIYYFSWTRVYVLKPRAIGECKQGGWREFGFRNQGQCVRFVNTGVDTR